MLFKKANQKWGYGGVAPDLEINTILPKHID